MTEKDKWVQDAVDALYEYMMSPMFFGATEDEFKKHMADIIGTAFKEYSKRGKSKVHGPYVGGKLIADAQEEE